MPKPNAAVTLTRKRTKSSWRRLMRWHESSIPISLKMISMRNPEFGSDDEEEQDRWDEEDDEELTREEENEGADDDEFPPRSDDI
jgi:hypothetical protein